ncbi:MAG: NAD(P)-dependent oxidoreductase [Austwickia sp.]|nr:NAD(P)-dependent oxidoreductase [Austwickia sp.]MCO5309521.1 NAD(P)-dependent oxidoreductase [Austwickia sp.]
MNQMTVGFIGASGMMGHGMAKNVAAAGYPLAYTVHRSPVADLDALGARRVADPAELGATCDVVIICVTGSPQVETVVQGPKGLLTRPRDGLVIIDASTSEPSSTARLAATALAKGVRYVDAPLTQGPAEAAAGTLNSLVGADDATFERVLPLVSTYSANVIHCGGTGAGHTVKLLNNFAVQAMANALAESFAVAAKAGVDPRVLVDVIAAGHLDCAFLHKMDRTLDGDYDVMRFELDNARKDMRYYVRLAGDQGVTSVVGQGVLSGLTLAHALGYGHEFVPSIVKAQAQLNGIEIRAGSPRP